ncbi:hypothetical protein [uncultured Wocania sp.]|uniref:hypothetical protein n=1 Tax=uncultured Wocania sp. TaxID=2834404 RepID=UPI0030FAB7F5
MYSETSILSLIQSVGFGELTDELIEITIDASHKVGTSARTFKGFHKLVTLENLYATVDVVDMNSQDFNNYLTQLKSDSARSALNKILNQHKLYQDSLDYSDTIITKLQLFTEVYGYQLAYDALEQMMVTKRENIESRNAKLASASLKMELEGAVNDNGKVIVKGLERRLLTAVNAASKIVFPEPLIVDDANAW